MPIDAALLAGRETNAEIVLSVLRQDVLPPAIRHMNEELLPFQFALYRDDRIPTNQRNLTDVRTRMGVLLEYELAKAIDHILGSDVTSQVSMTYIIANRFPDLAFRSNSGELGVRFEVKSIETVAEEKSANFDTQIKDIRKGTDFLVALLWEWREHDARLLRHPFIAEVFALDAYQMAQMRDTYWLNRPPSDPGTARQGFDLCFGVNCRSSEYNQEEGNYGKLMRIFSREYEAYLPQAVQDGSTLPEYFRFRETTIRLGLKRIATKIGESFLAQRKHGKMEVSADALPVVVVARAGADSLLILGDSEMAKKQKAAEIMAAHGVKRAVILNGKFDWRVRNADWDELASGNKPASAELWAAEA